MSLPLNKLIDSRYIIVRKIGEGGMSEIYQASDTYYHHDVALKILKSSSNSSENIERLKNEIRFVTAFNDSHIEKVYNIGTYQGRLFMTYELFKGLTIKELLDERGSLSRQEAVDYMIQILKGVSLIHSRNILHNDLKPDNLIITHDGTVKIFDFGIATHKENSKFDKLLASAQYVAPEVIINKEFSPQSDIYSLGTILFELITGKTPFMKGNTQEEIKAHLTENIPSISKYRNIDGYQEIDYVIAKATNRNLNKRYQSADEFLLDLNKIKEGKIIKSKFGFIKSL